MAYIDNKVVLAIKKEYVTVNGNVKLDDIAIKHKIDSNILGLLEEALAVSFKSDIGKKIKDSSAPPVVIIPLTFNFLE
jgi:hypothetical protein